MSSLRGEGLAAEVAAFDVADPDAVRSGVAAVQASFGPIDILVNNAGIQHRAPIVDFSDADWRRLMATNLDAPFYMARAVIPAMQARRAGKIINIASLMSSLARPTTVPYQVSKGGIAMLTRGLAVELAPHDIQVNAIAPGFFRTEMNAALTANAEFTAWVERRTPAGRWAEPHELAGAAVFLASPAARLRHRPDPLRRRRLHRRHVRPGGGESQSWPSVSASSWKRPSLWTSQISVNLTGPANRVGAGSGPARLIISDDRDADVGRVRRAADELDVARLAVRVDRRLDDDDGVDQRRQPALEDARRVGGVDVAGGVHPVRACVAGGRDLLHAAMQRLGQVGDLGRIRAKVGRYKQCAGGEMKTLHDDLRAASTPQNRAASPPSWRNQPMGLSVGDRLAAVSDASYRSTGGRDGTWRPSRCQP